MRREDENTSYNNASVLIQAFQMAAVYFADGEDSFSVSKHRESLYVFTWQGSKGMEVGGTDGVQVWDTSLSVLAVVEAGLATQCSFRAVMIKALEYLEMSQLRHNVCDPYRQQRKGGWTFSTKTNGLIVTDCSAETLKAVILLQEDW